MNQTKAKHGDTLLLLKGSQQFRACMRKRRLLGVAKDAEEALLALNGLACCQEQLWCSPHWGSIQMILQASLKTPLHLVPCIEMGKDHVHNDYLFSILVFLVIFLKCRNEQLLLQKSHFLK